MFQANVTNIDCLPCRYKIDHSILGTTIIQSLLDKASTRISRVEKIINTTLSFYRNFVSF